MFQLSPQILQLLQSQFGSAMPRPMPLGLPGTGMPMKPGMGQMPMPFFPRAGMVPLQLGKPFSDFRALLDGTVSGGTGTRGPAPSSFVGLQKFAGPFGNGGGPIAPSFGATPWQKF